MCPFKTIDKTYKKSYPLRKTNTCCPEMKHFKRLMRISFNKETNTKRSQDWEIYK